MESAKKFEEILPINITLLLKKHYFHLMSNFYEMQSSFLTSVYRVYGGVESANIVMCFARNTHLGIIRQREKNLNYDVSFEKFLYNFGQINVQTEKIASISKLTGIPKETVRRKIKNLLNKGTLSNNKNLTGYSLNLLQTKQSSYLKMLDTEMNILAKFISKFCKHLNLKLNSTAIEKELKSQFSFYWYHFLSCQLQWLKMWQTKLKDNDLILIILQTIIPTLQYVNKKQENINIGNLFKEIGKTNFKNNLNFSEAAVSATTVAEVTGIPRVTCIRKLEKLVLLGFLEREKKSKRYFVNQNTDARTKNILTKENVNFTIEIYSQFVATILNSLIQNRI